MNMQRLQNTLEHHEGLRLKPYKDSVGKLTIGIGRNLDDVGISKSEALLLLQNDIDVAINKLRTNYSWFSALSEIRQEILINMVFNMGITRFKGFKKMIHALEQADYTAASVEMLDSKWASQVGNRATELSAAMLKGEF